MNKAIYKFKVKEKYNDAVHLFYEYRGHEYMVTDEHNGYSKPMWEKHKEEQRRIDQMIDRKEHNTNNTESNNCVEDWWEVFNMEM